MFSGQPAAAQPTIGTCDDAQSWNRFLASQPGGSFYHLYEWQKVNAESFGHQHIPLVAWAGGIAGVLPLVLVESHLFGRILCSMPFVNFGGPCAIDARVERALAEAAIDKADELDVDYLELRCTQPLDIGLEASLRKVSMTIPLAPDPDTLWNGFTSKHRKNVKRAYKNDLAVKIGGLELLPTFYSMMEESWRNLGTPLYSREYFQRVLETFPDNTRVFVCHRNEQPVAVSLCGYFNGMVEGLWAGGGALARELDANYVLYWEMIRDACTRGCRAFHLGRSTADSGSEDFKRRWNAEPHQLYWYFHRPDGGELPQLNVANPKFQLAIQAWRRMPMWATRLLGPRIAPSIP